MSGMFRHVHCDNVTVTHTIDISKYNGHADPYHDAVYITKFNGYVDAHYVANKLCMLHSSYITPSMALSSKKG